MDTGFWIDLTDNPRYFNQLSNHVEKGELEILFSYGNFIDLIKGKNQDELIHIILSLVHEYIPYQDYAGQKYKTSTEFQSLIPNERDRLEFERQTNFLDEDIALEYLFRTTNWETPEKYVKMTHNMKSIHDDFGFDNSMAYVFWEYSEAQGEERRLQQHEIDTAEFIRKMLALQRIEQIKPEETIDTNDFADMEICAHAFLANCDILIIESKWINTEVIQRVDAELDSQDLKLFDNFPDFLGFLEDGEG